MATLPKVKKIRKAAKEIQEAEGIPLIFFIMLLMAAVILDIVDLAEAIPIVGQIIVFFIGAIGGLGLFILYYAVGARHLSSVIAMLLDFVIEQIPGLNVLPTYTITVILVYLLTSIVTKRANAAAFQAAEQVSRAERLSQVTRVAGAAGA